MPTFVRDGPYRIYVYSSDGDEPPHVHVQRDNAVAKYWLEPLRLQSSAGFSAAELRDVHRLLDVHRNACLRQWNEYFG
ncbi:MAG: DUF4160 domain-containing protein [Pseudomonadota bacterium]